MTVIEAIDSLFDVVSAVFAEAPRQAPDHESNSRRFRKAIERLINTRGIPLNAKMYEKTQPQPRCKVYVFSHANMLYLTLPSALYAAASADIAQPYVFRTYSSRGSSLNPTIVDAICATISVPSHFLPTKIMSRPVEHNFVGGPLGANNPTRELLKEADATHGNDGRVTQIISIGGGSSPVLSLDTMGGGGVGRLLVEMAADCQMVAHELAERLFNVESYTRLNSEKSAENIEFGNWDTLGVVETRTRRYTETPNVSNMLDISLKSLRNKVGTITLGRLSKFLGCPFEFTAMGTD